MVSIRRGDILLVRLGHTRGAEVRKTRPAVVISNDASNDVSPLVTVVPMTTSTKRIYPFEVAIPAAAGARRDSKAMANQVRTVSKRRVARKLGAVSAEIMAAIEEAVLLHLGIER